MQVFNVVAGRYLRSSSGGTGKHLHPCWSGTVGQQSYRRKNRRTRRNTQIQTQGTEAKNPLARKVTVELTTELHSNVILFHGRTRTAYLYRCVWNGITRR